MNHIQDEEGNEEEGFSNSGDEYEEPQLDYTSYDDYFDTIDGHEQTGTRRASRNISDRKDSRGEDEEYSSDDYTDWRQTLTTKNFKSRHSESVSLAQKSVAANCDGHEGTPMAASAAQPKETATAGYASRPLIVCIDGNIGVGKTSVLEELRTRGYWVSPRSSHD